MVTELSPFLCGKYELLSYWKSYMKYVYMIMCIQTITTRSDPRILFFEDEVCIHEVCIH